MSALIDRREKHPQDRLSDEVTGVGVPEKQFSRLGEILGAGDAILDDLPDDVRE